MSYFDRKSFGTRSNMNNDDIEGSKPCSYINKFGRRDPLKVDDIVGASPSSIVGYTGSTRRKMRRSTQQFIYGPTKRQLKDQWFSPTKLENKSTVFNSSSVNFGREDQSYYNNSNSFNYETKSLGSSIGNLKQKNTNHGFNKSVDLGYRMNPSSIVNSTNFAKPIDSYGNNMINKPRNVTFKQNLATTADQILSDAKSGFRKTPIK